MVVPYEGHSAGFQVARMFARYSDAELEVIADFLERNAERLRAETAALGDF